MSNKQNNILSDIIKICPKLSKNLNSIIKKSSTNKRKKQDTMIKQQVKKVKKNIIQCSESDSEYNENEFTESDSEFIETASDDEINETKFKPYMDPLINKNLWEIESEYINNKITIDKIIFEQFNKKDTLWFYKNLKRLDKLEGSEKFQLEDKIEQRFKLLKLAKKTDDVNSSFCVERDITQDVVNSEHPKHVKNILLNKLYNTSSEFTEEYQKTINWIDTILKIPTKIKTTDIDVSTTIKTLYNKLSTNLFGMDKIIRDVLQGVCTILSDPDSNGYILTLVGPPGVGKTTISNMIAESIGMGFNQISCGGINDQSVITGSNSIYIGSKPGILTQQLITSKQLDNVIVFDELDKISDSKVIPILLHILDKSQNSRFKDAYCPEIDIDLSKNLYIITVNSTDNLDSALKDRLKIINIDGYSIEQKVQICIKHTIPTLIKKTGLKLKFDNNVIKECIVHISPDISGIRTIERFFSDIFEKLLLIKLIGATAYGLPSNFKFNNLNKVTLNLIKKLDNYF